MDYVSNKTVQTMVFKLVAAASQHWRRLDGSKLLPKIVLGGKFPIGPEILPTVDTQPHAAT